MNECGGLEGLSCLLPGDLVGGKTPEFVVNKWQQFGGCCGVTAFHQFQNACEIIHLASDTRLIEICNSRNRSSGPQESGNDPSTSSKNSWGPWPFTRGGGARVRTTGRNGFAEVGRLMVYADFFHLRTKVAMGGNSVTKHQTVKPFINPEWVACPPDIRNEPRNFTNLREGNQDAASYSC